MLLPGRLRFVYREPYSDDPYSTDVTDNEIASLRKSQVLGNAGLLFNSIVLLGLEVEGQEVVVEVIDILLDEAAYSNRLVVE